MSAKFSSRRNWVLAIFAVLLLMAPAKAENKLGVVLLHGKMAGPSVFQGLAGTLEQDGILVACPEMPWSRSRYLDAPFKAALEEIAAAVQSLKQKGASRIVIGGHSLGAVAALAYAAIRDEVAGLILLAPGHYPDSPAFQHNLGNSLATAQEMVKAGRGGESREFLDTNMGRVFNISTKAQIYVSFFSPESPISPGQDAARLSPKIPVLCILGDKDPLSPKTRKHVLLRLPANPLSRVATVPGGHMDVPSEAKSEVVRWLKSLPH